MTNTYEEIEDCVDTLIEEYNLNSIPIDLQLLSKEVEIPLHAYEDAGSGISGALIRNGYDYRILYSTKINNTGRHRFSIAHEFGHYFLEGHPEALFKNSNKHESRAYGSSNPIEKEADYFATCLLMPRQFFTSDIQALPCNLDSICKISDKYNTSLTSTAIRYAQLSLEAVSIIVSENGIIKFSKHSEKMKSIGKTTKSYKDKSIPTKSLTASDDFILSSQDNIGSLDNWITCDSNLQCREEVLDLGSYGKRLSIIKAL